MGSRRVLAVVLALLALLSIAAAHRKLLVFLLDGFRFDYIDDKELETLPGFQNIVSMGVKVDYMTPDFPSLSYPNYYTLMTGEHSRFLVVMLSGAASILRRGGGHFSHTFPVEKL